MLHSALAYTHELLKQAVDSGDTVIDATVGNGGDTLFLARLVGEDGHVIGFDVQSLAIENTVRKLSEAQLSKQVSLHQLGHEKLYTVCSAPQSVSAVVFNLGYLPKGDKSVITTSHTTIEGIKQALDVLKVNGLILVMIYYGHPGGPEEKEAVLNFVQTLPQKNYHVLKYEFINQKNSPPFLIAIEKR